MVVSLPTELFRDIVAVSDSLAGRAIKYMCRATRAVVTKDDLISGEAGWRYHTKGFYDVWAWAVRKWHRDILSTYLDEAAYGSLRLAIRHVINKNDRKMFRALLGSLTNQIRPRAARCDSDLSSALSQALKKDYEDTLKALKEAGLFLTPDPTEPPYSPTNVPQYFHFSSIPWDEYMSYFKGEQSDPVVLTQDPALGMCQSWLLTHESYLFADQPFILPRESRLLSRKPVLLSD
ncbi:hypothetical protein HDV00_004071 [Rhizophlyctis rosea]|nr:hypothetical protein HDV00_004071 [Rhizophlyctis rosea]